MLKEKMTEEDEIDLLYNQNRPLPTSKAELTAFRDKVQSTARAVSKRTVEAWLEEFNWRTENAGNIPNGPFVGKKKKKYPVSPEFAKVNELYNIFNKVMTNRKDTADRNLRPPCAGGGKEIAEE